MELKANWSYPTKVRFGAGRISELPDACREAGMTRPLLITDPGLAALDLVGDALRRNEAAGLPTGLFCDIKANPTGANVEAGVAAYLGGGHDGVIAFGGGSGLDAAKAVALMVGQERPIWDFEDIGDWWTRAKAEAIAPIVAVPTTAGTGSEMGRAAVIVDEDNHAKKIIFHPRLLAYSVIADPELTLGLPARLTAATGMDALAHCLEAYCAPGYHPMAAGIALEGMRLIRENLPRAVADGRDLDARAHMLAAAGMGATAFQRGLGSIHSLSHPLGAIYDKHHGLLNAIIMPYALEQNRVAIVERMGPLAAYLGLPGAAGDGYDAVLHWILDLRRELGIPHSLAEIDIDETRAEEIARMAEADPSTASNAMPIDAGDLEQLFRNAVRGRLS